MEIHPIFADQDCLLTVQYNDQEVDEFRRLLEEWTDLEWLEEFFSNNEADLDKFHDGCSVEDAIIVTRLNAKHFLKQIHAISEKGEVERIELMKNLFQSLSKKYPDDEYLQKKKAYGSRSHNWLRFYALKIEEDQYLITGGAIKLTQKMQDRQHTNEELIKINNCRDYLDEKGIIDHAGMAELLEFGE
nr:hypothetical protein [Bacteroidota bacterium]